LDRYQSSTNDFKKRVTFKELQKSQATITTVRN
jgi:hypothetical protein